MESSQHHKTIKFERYCKPDEIWVCGACGKTSERDKYGDNDNSGWDVSCMLNSVKCTRNSIIYNKETSRVEKVI